LRKVSYSPQVRRPSNAAGASASDREAFKKSLPPKLRRLKEAHPEAERVQLWAENEARLGLKPVTRRVWAPVGERPVARFKRGYEWSYLYGFVRPHSGEVFWMMLPTVNTELFSLAFREFAEEVGAGKQRRILLVVDQAGWHTGGEMEIPEKGYTWSFCRRALRSSCRRRGCGR
jgi:hypothetical protein